MAESGKQTRGKQAIDIKKIENEKERMITFSKRKSGIYKKASELATLTGAQVGVLVFSQSGKPYSFGHPSIEAISNRFLGVNQPVNDNTHSLVEAHKQVRIAELNQYQNDLVRQLAAEKEREKMLKEMTKGKNTQGWWDAPIDDLTVEELHQMDEAFEEMSKTLHNQKSQMNLGGGEPSSALLPPMSPPQTGSQFPDSHC
ncbi:hypothetical protein ACOSQ2_013628 [Xanthoceras sorbifolium]